MTVKKAEKVLLHRVRLLPSRRWLFCKACAYRESREIILRERDAAHSVKLFRGREAG